MPTEVLRPSPLDLGGVIGGAFRILKQRFGGFVVLALIPSILVTVVLVAAMIPLLFGIFDAIRVQRFSGLIVLGVLLMFAAVVVGGLAQIKVQAMMVLGAHDAIHGHQSTLGELHRRTPGVVGRVVLLLLAVSAATFLLVGLIMGGMFAAILGAIATSGEDPTAAITAGIVSYIVFLFLMVALSIVAFYLQVRFLYFLPGLAVEQLGAVQSLKRSWALTKGNVLRTLGYYLVGTFLVSAATMVIQIFTQMLAVPFSSNGSSEPNSAQVAGLIAVMAITMGLQILVQIVALPFLSTYQTVMYVDQVRRNTLPQGFGPGGYPAPYAGQPQQQWQPQQQPQQWQAPGVPPGAPQPNQPNQQWGQNQQWGGPGQNPGAY